MKADKELLNELIEVGERLLGDNQDLRTLTMNDRAELRRAAKLLFPLLERMADDAAREDGR